MTPSPTVRPAHSSELVAIMRVVDAARGIMRADGNL